MASFTMNGRPWQVIFTDPYDPMLVDRTGRITVGTTDPRTSTVYLSSELQGEFLTRVLIHELGHCALFSFDLLDDIHRMVMPAYWVEAEEWICNFIADYGMTIFNAAKNVLGESAWTVIPYELERLAA